MARLTSLFLLGAGALVLVTWLDSPASSAPPQIAASPASAVSSTPEFDVFGDSLEQLSRQQAADAAPVVVTRNPFQFAGASMGRTDGDRVGVDARLPDLDVSTVRWPRLVAILSSGPDDAPVRQVVIEDAAQMIRILSAGESIAGIRVERITADAVTFTTTSGQTTRLSLD